MGYEWILLFHKAMVCPGTSEKDMNNWDQLTTKNGVPSWFNNKQIYVLVWGFWTSPEKVSVGDYIIYIILYSRSFWVMWKIMTFTKPWFAFLKRKVLIEPWPSNHEQRGFTMNELDQLTSHSMEGFSRIKDLDPTFHRGFSHWKIDKHGLWKRAFYANITGIWW
jgi:hypothetical protein